MRVLDNDTRASNPGQIRYSRAKLKRQRPDLFGLWATVRRLWAPLPQLAFIREQLQYGDSRAAVVVKELPLLVAAYTDELDCVAILRFSKSYRADYKLTLGSRLLTVNTYKPGTEYDPDLIPGPNRHHRWVGFTPIIADFVSDDLARIEARKAQITEVEWAKTATLGASYLAAKPGSARDGRALYSTIPAGMLDWHYPEDRQYQLG